MFKRIKELLSKPEPTEIEVDESRLKSWLEEETQKRLEEFEKEAAEIDNEIGEIKKEIEKKLEDLNKAELKNTKITTKEIQYMQGNRQSFIKNVQNFLYNLPYNQDGELFSQSQENFFEALDELNKSNRKPAAILQHFFANEVRYIGNDILTLENKYKNAKELYSGKHIETLKKALAEIQAYYNQNVKVETYQKKLKEKEKEIRNLENEKERIQVEMQRLEETPGFKKFNELVEKKKEINEKIKKLKENVQNNFSLLYPAIKKYSRSCLDEELCNSLLNSVPETLNKYESDRIMKFIDKLSENLKENKLELKEKKKEKAENSIKKINKEDIDSFKENLKELKKNRRDIEYKLQNNQLLTDYSELGYRLEHLNKKKEKKKEEIKHFKEKDFTVDAKTPENIIDQLNEEIPDMNLVLKSKNNDN